MGAKKTRKKPSFYASEIKPAIGLPPFAFGRDLPGAASFPQGLHVTAAARAASWRFPAHLALLPDDRYIIPAFSRLNKTHGTFFTGRSVEKRKKTVYNEDDCVYFCRKNGGNPLETDHPLHTALSVAHHRRGQLQVSGHGDRAAAAQSAGLYSGHGHPPSIRGTGIPVRRADAGVRAGGAGGQCDRQPGSGVRGTGRDPCPAA